MPMIDPDKEALASTRMVRSGMRTPDDVVREQGFDPDVFWPEYAQSQKRLDELGIVLDTDARKRTQAGNDVTPKAGPKRG
jgi:capsid protein